MVRVRRSVVDPVVQAAHAHRSTRAPRVRLTSQGSVLVALVVQADRPWATVVPVRLALAGRQWAWISVHSSRPSADGARLVSVTSCWR